MSGGFLAFIKRVLGLETERVDNKKGKVKMVSLSAWWGNGDVGSDIVIPLSKWEEILEGLEYEIDGDSWYEGECFNVTWQFNKEYKKSSKGYFTIYDGNNGRECILDQPLSNINVCLIDKE